MSSNLQLAGGCDFRCPTVCTECQVNGSSIGVFCNDSLLTSDCPETLAVTVSFDALTRYNVCWCCVDRDELDPPWYPCLEGCYWEINTMTIPAHTTTVIVEMDTTYNNCKYSGTLEKYSIPDIERWKCVDMGWECDPPCCCEDESMPLTQRETQIELIDNTLWAEHAIVLTPCVDMPDDHEVCQGVTVFVEEKYYRSDDLLSGKVTWAAGMQGRQSHPSCYGHDWGTPCYSWVDGEPAVAMGSPSPNAGHDQTGEVKAEYRCGGSGQQYIWNYNEYPGTGSYQCEKSYINMVSIS